MGIISRTPITSSHGSPPAIAATATTLSRLMAASASAITTAADIRSVGEPTELANVDIVIHAEPEVERDDHERPGGHKLDQRHPKQRVGEEDQEEPQNDRPAGAERQRAARVLGRKTAACESNDDCVVGAEQEVDKEHLREKEKP